MRYRLTIFNADTLEQDELWDVTLGRYNYLDHSLRLSSLGFESRAMAQLKHRPARQAHPDFEHAGHPSLGRTSIDRVAPSLQIITSPMPDSKD
jgi:hypothetical protein